MTIVNHPLTDAEEAFLLAGLDAHAAATGGDPYVERPFGLIKLDDQGIIIGGMMGRIYWEAVSRSVLGRSRPSRTRHRHRPV